MDFKTAFNIVNGRQPTLSDFSASMYDQGASVIAAAQAIQETTNNQTSDNQATNNQTSEIPAAVPVDSGYTPPNPSKAELDLIKKQLKHFLMVVKNSKLKFN